MPKQIFQNLNLKHETIQGTMYPGDVARDSTFTKCSFLDCWNNSNDQDFCFAENLVLENTNLKTKRISNFIFRNVTINNCKNTALFRIENCLFSKVKLTGKFGSWWIHSITWHISDYKKEYTAKFYSGVEWALDITEAYFKAFDLRDIPAEKVRRDPDRHFLVLKDKFLADPSWRKIVKDIGWTAVVEDAITNEYYGDIIWCIPDLAKEPKRKGRALLFNKLKKAGFLA